jgi:hypothetical protein
MLQIAGEMVSIIVLALTGRVIGFAQSTLEGAAPMTVDRALSYIASILSVFVHPEYVALLVSVLGIASVIRIGIAYTDRSILLALRQRAGIVSEELSWTERAMRLPVAALYRGLTGIATLVGAIALAVCFRLFDPDRPFGFADLAAYMSSVASGISYASVGALLVLFSLYGVALAIIGYVASPAVLSLDEMARGCRVEREPAVQR